MTLTDCILSVATLAAFIIFLAKKWGFVEYVQVYGNEFFHKMFSCDFCLSWWTSLLVSAVFFSVSGNIYFAFTPFCSTLICRYLL